VISRQRDLVLAVTFALSLGCDRAVAASPRSSAEHPKLLQTRHLGPRHHPHGYADRRYGPVYLDRPIDYAPAPFFLFPPYLAYGWELR
jgi:hypothetical protein